MQTETIKNAIVSFSFDWLAILSVIGNDVYIRANYSVDEGNTINDCVAILNRRLYTYTHEAWLDKKAELYDTYKHFCGEGSIFCGSTIDEGTMNVKDFEDEFFLLPVFRVLTVEIEMEHG